MNSNWQALKLLLSAIAAVAFCCQCQTTDEPEIATSLPKSKFGKLGRVNEVGLKRESGYKIAGTNDHELVSSGKKNEGKDRMSDSLKNKKVIKNSKGEVVRKEDRDDLYSDRSSTKVRESGRTFDGNKKAKIKSDKYAKKEFKTPDYLKRQEFAAKTFKDGGQKAPEAGQSTKFAKKLFKTDNSDFQNQLARENRSTTNRFSRSFKTGNDKIGSDAYRNAANATGVKGVSGYKDNLKMSMDDVRKLVNPSSSR